MLEHVEREGFQGAPRALGFDEWGREVLTFVDGDVGAAWPDTGAEPVDDIDHWVWRDEVLVHLGVLVRKYHDAAANFSWAGHEWQVEIQEPVETICHNDLALANVVFRAGVPVALIDWEAAAPGPRAQDLGFAAWRFVPFSVPINESAHGVKEKARRLRVLLTAYGVEPDTGFVDAAIKRMRQFLDHLSELAASGSEWEVEHARRGVLAELTREVAWVEGHAAALIDP